MNKYAYSIILMASMFLGSPNISLAEDCEEGLTGFMRGLDLTWSADIDEGFATYESVEYKTKLSEWTPNLSNKEMLLLGRI